MFNASKAEPNTNTFCKRADLCGFQRLFNLKRLNINKLDQKLQLRILYLPNIP